MQDVVDPVMDEMLATFVVDSHFKSHPRANHVEEETRTRNESADKEVRVKLIFHILLLRWTG